MSFLIGLWIIKFLPLQLFRFFEILLPDFLNPHLFYLNSENSPLRLGLSELYVKNVLLNSQFDPNLCLHWYQGKFLSECFCSLPLILYQNLCTSGFILLRDSINLSTFFLLPFLLLYTSFSFILNDHLLYRRYPIRFLSLSFYLLRLAYN